MLKISFGFTSHMNTKTIYLNQDDSAFNRLHPLDDMTVEGLQTMVDFYAKGEQLGGLAFCVNMQRALFNSKVWETMDKAIKPNAEGVLVGPREAFAMTALLERKVDQFQVWLDRTRFHGIEAALSMRMNDCHGLESHGGFKNEKGPDQSHFTNHASDFWKANRQLRRAPYRYERSFEAAFNYAKEEVRNHHLNLVREVLGRYDMDVFEMDWMRWLYMFAPGSEQAGRDLLTGFIAEVDQLRKAAEKRVGHSIQLRHRIPADPQTCYNLGYDVAEWAQRGMADQIILSAFGTIANFDYQIALWRRLVGSAVRILVLVEPFTGASPKGKAESYHFDFGCASAALQRGADGVYLFNDCYLEVGGPEQRDLLLQMLNTMGSNTTLNQVVRRHPVTFTQVRSPGEPPHITLPIPLRNSVPGEDTGRFADNITLRLSVGSKPDRARYVLRLGFSEETPMCDLQGVTVRINTHPIQPTDEPVFEDVTAKAFPKRKIVSLPPHVQHLVHFEIPAENLHEDVNVVEFEPGVETGSLEWAEIIILPEGK